MAKAIWNGVIIAESNEYEKMEGNIYFPANSIKTEFFKSSNKHTTCPWKGIASYYTIEIKGKRNENAAWFYPAPKEAAKNIKDHVAFWKGVKIEE